jgi:hypothetical protein
MSTPAPYKQPIDNMPFCGFCGGRHEYMNGLQDLEPILCGFCHACWRYCQHNPQCSWPEQPKQATEKQAVNTQKVAENLAIHTLREAFEAWYLSSGYEGDVDGAWAEFEMFAKEQLTLVPQDARYLQIRFDAGKVKEFELLDAANLYKNQDGSYVVVDGKKRRRIGKDVAVMP